MSASSLDTLYECEARVRDEALRLLGDARFQLEQARAQASQLQGYLQEYQRNHRQRMQGGGGVELLQCHDGFVRRLHQAIDQQGGIVRGAEMREEQARLHVQQCEMRLQSVAKLVERRRHEQRRVALRQEQRASDESASRARPGAHGGATNRAQSHFESPTC